MLDKILQSTHFQFNECEQWCPTIYEQLISILEKKEK